MMGFTAALLVLAASTAPLRATPPLDEALLTPEDHADLERGRVVARVVDTDDRSEVMSVAGIRVQATAARFMECARDPSCLRASDDLLEAGVLRSPPAASDLRGLNLQPRDLGSLRRCRVGYCDVRLSADVIERLRREVDWRSPASAQEAAAVFRHALAVYAEAYLHQGDPGLMRYQDDPEPVSVREGLGMLLRRLAGPLATVPGLKRFLDGFPCPRPSGIEDFLYWYQERFWRKTVVALNHVVIVEPEPQRHQPVFVLTKQLYATHYFESSVELLAFDESRGGGPAQITYVSRSRADIRPTGFNAIERFLVRRLVRGRLQRQLEAIRETLEAREGVAAARWARSLELRPADALSASVGTRAGAAARSRGGTPLP
jgi:hypothetical protein